MAQLFFAAAIFTQLYGLNCKVFQLFIIVFLFAFVGIDILGSSQVYASGGSFNVPQVNDHFEKVKQGPAPEKESSLSQTPQKEHGTWDWLTKPVSHAWKWTKETVSSAWNKTKEFCSKAWDWICKVCDQITKVVVDGLSSAWDWIVKYKEYVAFTAVVIVGIALCLVPPLGEEILAGVALSFIMSVLMNGGKIDKNTFMDAAIGGLLGPIGDGIAVGVSRGLASGIGRKLLTGVAESRVFGPLVRYGGKLISKLPGPFQKIFSKAGFIGSVEGAGTSIADDLLHGRKINWKMAFFAGLFGAGMVGVVSFAQPVIDKATASIKPLLAKIPIVKNLDNCFAYNQSPGYFAIATNSFEIKCLYSPDKEGTGGGGADTSKKLVAGTVEHKAQRWKEYKESGGDWDYERWSKVYDLNMNRAKNANKAMDEFHKKLGWGQREVTVMADGHLRRLDIADKALKKGIEHKTRAVSDGKGYFYLSEEIKWEIQRDEYLVHEEGWDITWVFENADASEPLKEALKKAGIKFKFIGKGGSISDGK
ncbi:hypothetical protein [Thermoactinomyces sp. CICC 10521]|uniref:hypothetical protein n=1 Tax=Thermoactinomyces sp. CICC 10521 TaxID=2767426 RepID=UPI0018DB1164|nr:hypothetical protein [Thermoactinomyces sp. CICC 10521]MBH8609262.1 hypothetical protein [Thermoactinomyces sp. CICC 10521]